MMMIMMMMLMMTMMMMIIIMKLMLMMMSMTMFFSSLTVDGSSKIEPCPGTCVPERGQIRGGSPRSWYLRPRKGPDPGAAADQRKGGSQPAG